MKRSQFNNRIQGLKDEKRSADINYNSAVSTLELIKGKIKEMNLAIDKIKNPAKYIEEKKRNASPNRRTLSKQRTRKSFKALPKK
jgi:hypothetical protein